MAQIADELAAQGIGLSLARLETPILELWTRAGAIDAVGREHVYVDLRDAVAANSSRSR